MSAEAKHTPGPWSPMWQNSRARPCGGGVTYWEIPVCVGDWPNVGNAICMVHMGGDGATSSTKESVEANARLIAAAPDILEALKAVNRLVSEAAMTGFNWQDGDWADRLFESQQATSKALAKAEGRS